MSRFLMYYTGDGPKPQSDVDKVRAMSGVVVVSDALPRSVVLEVANELVEQRLKRIPSWSLQESQTVSLDIGSTGTGATKQVPGFRLVR